jgi:hypothetical protein
MCKVFLQLCRLLKKYLSLSSIKATYGKVSDMVKRVAKRDDVRMYSAYAWYVIWGMWFVLLTAWNIFTFMLAYKLFAQGMSLYIEGWSGTMTIEFETAWLVLAVKVFFVVLIGGSVILLIGAIDRFIKVRKKLDALLKDKTETDNKKVKGQ